MNVKSLRKRTKIMPEFEALPCRHTFTYRLHLNIKTWTSELSFQKWRRLVDIFYGLLTATLQVRGAHGAEILKNQWLCIAFRLHPLTKQSVESWEFIRKKTSLTRRHGGNFRPTPTNCTSKRRKNTCASENVDLESLARSCLAGGEFVRQVAQFFLH